MHTLCTVGACAPPTQYKSFTAFSPIYIYFMDMDMVGLHLVSVSV